MRLILTFGLIFIVTFGFSQENETCQSDSIYKINKVKARKWYMGSNRKLMSTTFYDQEGRLIKFQLEPFMPGEQRTTYYIYDNNGLLINKVDTTKNGKPDREQMKQLKKMGLNPKLFLTGKNKPPIEVSNYDIAYDKGQIIKITKYNPDRTLDIVDHYKNDGLSQIREWYRDNEIYQISNADYLTKYLKAKYYGWEKDRNGNKSEWNYKFEYRFEVGRVIECTRYDGDSKKETIKYYYDSNGLLIKTDGYTLDFFEYEYYK